MRRSGGRFVWLVSFLFASQLCAAMSIESAVAALKRGSNLTIAGEPICATHPLPLFYERRNLKPAWSDADTAALVAAIRRAHDDGLEPDEYHLAAIQAAAGDEADLLKTDAFFLLATHLLSGRTDPVTIEPTWCLAPRTSDLVPALETALENDEIEETLAQFRPAHVGYHQLADALATYRQMKPWQPVAPGAALRLGDSGPRVAQLVARLVASGDIDPQHATFDERVQDAVKRFQRVHELDADGVAGARTIHEMNVPLDARIRQLEINLERWRWLPANLGARHAMINIPQFLLQVVENNNTVLAMRVVVGKDYTHRTPVFSASVTQVVFNPYWNVPESIAHKELWPKQRSDRSYFRRNHFEVVNGQLRQTPGAWNALGFIKFNLPNPYTVYLHDTPSRQLFSRAVLTFSHGCMRIEKPVDFAEYVLRDVPGWTRDRIIAESEKGKEHAIDVKSPLMVHVLYWTAFVNDRGEVHFAPDVYGRDPALDEAMRKRPESF